MALADITKERVAIAVIQWIVTNGYFTDSNDGKNAAEYAAGVVVGEPGRSKPKQALYKECVAYALRLLKGVK